MKPSLSIKAACGQLYRGVIKEERARVAIHRLARGGRRNARRRRRMLRWARRHIRVYCANLKLGGAVRRAAGGAS